MLATHTVFKQSSKHGPSETLALCVLLAAMVLPAPKIWRYPTAPLAAMVHCPMGTVLQPLLTAEEMGKVALTCRFACDALCAELYDWDENWAQARTFTAEPGCELSALGAQWCLASPEGAIVAGVGVRILLSFARTVTLSSHKSQERERE